MLPALTLFLSAFLLFSVQPLLGKQMLPFIGGTTMGWLTLLVFFQLVLLAGYALAYALNRYTPRRQATVALVFVAAGLVSLPPAFAAHASLGDVGGVLMALGFSILLPALALSLISSTVQRLVASTGRSNPYHLYAASNAGSLLGLLTYPLVFEPLLSLQQHRLMWAVGYVLLLALLATILFKSHSVAGQPLVPERLTWHQRLKWIVYAMIPASLSYGLVSYVTMELGSFPLFWIIPLGLYLLSFIIAFGPRPPAVRPLGHAALGLTLLIVVLLCLGMSHVVVPAYLLLVLLPLQFLLLAVILHTRLALSRPAPGSLSEYYLWLAAGGAIGGLFNVFVVPIVFPYPLEFIAMAGIALCFLDIAPRLAPVIRGVSVVAVLLLVIVSQLLAHSDKFQTRRNFFGTAIVYDAPDNEGRLTRYLTTGVGFQSAQLLEAEAGRVPSFYFAPLDSLFRGNRQPAKVGMLGLGAGTALCFNSQSRNFTVYEIDPKIREIAERDFTYIRDCGMPEWRMGDGRIELLHDADKRFDVLIIDAFHSVNIPLHLLTREALQLYRDRLTPQGVLVYNLNSVYYDLFPQLAAQAQEIGWQALKSPAWNWAVLAAPDVDLQDLKSLGWTVVPASSATVWSDDWTNPLSALISWRALASR